MAFIASWLSMFRRQPDLIIAALKLGSGVRLADVGAGRGYFTFRFTKVIGPSDIKGPYEAMSLASVTPH